METLLAFVMFLGILGGVTFALLRIPALRNGTHKESAETKPVKHAPSTATAINWMPLVKWIAIIIFFVYVLIMGGLAAVGGGLIMWAALASAFGGATRTRRTNVGRNPTQDMKIAVALRDGGACVKCGSDYELQYDHIRPWSRGGETTVENLQLLCGPCNRRKSNR